MKIIFQKNEIGYKKILEVLLLSILLCYLIYAFFQISVIDYFPIMLWSNLMIVVMVLYLLCGIIDNHFISSIKKNISFIDAYTFGHFLLGIAVYLVYVPIHWFIYHFDSPALHVIFYSILFSFLFEIFEYLLYNSAKFRKMRKDWYDNFESENNLTHFDKGMKDESNLNLLSDHIFVCLGTCYSYLIQYFYTYWTVLVISAIGFLFFMLIIKRKLYTNLQQNIKIIKVKNR